MFQWRLVDPNSLKYCRPSSADGKQLEITGSALPGAAGECSEGKTHNPHRKFIKEERDVLNVHKNINIIPSHHKYFLVFVLKFNHKLEKCEIQ